MNTDQVKILKLRNSILKKLRKVIPEVDDVTVDLCSSKRRVTYDYWVWTENIESLAYLLNITSNNPNVIADKLISKYKLEQELKEGGQEATGI